MIFTLQPHSAARAFVASALALCIGIGAASAAQRTFVASYGNDANPCSLLQPCRSFNPAITAADPSGEVIVLDSAGYGAFTVTKPISITAPAGIYAGVSPSAGDAVVIDVASGAVKLTGLAINRPAIGFTLIGIHVLSGTPNVLIDRCTIAGQGNAVQDDAASSSVTVRDTRIEDGGIHILPTTGSVSLVIDRTTIANAFVNSNAAVALLGPVVATIRDSVIANSFFGVELNPSSAGTFVLDIDRTQFQQNDTGTHLIADVAGSVVTTRITDSRFVASAGDAVFVQAINGGSIDVSIDRTIMDAGGLRAVRARNFPASVSNVSITDSHLTGSGADAILVEGATVRIARNTIVRNDRGFNISTGALRTTGDNLIENNTNANIGALQPITLQ